MRAGSYEIKRTKEKRVERAKKDGFCEIGFLLFPGGREGVCEFERAARYRRRRRRSVVSLRGAAG